MKVVKSLNIDDLLFLDIETCRIVDKLEKGTQLYDSWEYKMRYSREAEKFEEDSLEETFNKKAALYAEFAKIVCVTIGMIKNEKLVLKSYYGDNEEELLIAFCNTLDGLCAKNRNVRLVTHAGIGFDIPFLMRRCLIHGIDLPLLIDIADEKPWLLTTIDTLNLWKGTGFYSASLLNIATAFGLPSPKQDINGSQTSDVYYNEGKKGIEKIKKYCEEDVLTLANIIRKIRKENILESEYSNVNVEKAPLMEKIFNTKKVSAKEKAHLNGVLKDMDEEELEKANEILSMTLPKENK